jgi:hypothetical protein
MGTGLEHPAMLTIRFRRAAVAASAAVVTLVAALAGPVPTPAVASADATFVSVVASPSTSPAVGHRVIGRVAPGDCPSGYLCAWVNLGSDWEQFNFFHCGLYRLSNWHDPSVLGSSYYANHQTRGAVARFYDQNGRQLFAAAPAPGTPAVPLDGGWEPVWSIRPC